MKHPYRVGCNCPRCEKELTRRTAQSAEEFRRHPKPIRRQRTRVSSRKPAWGTQEWAETRGDDIPSLDQPGDDFDMEN